MGKPCFPSVIVMGRHGREGRTMLSDLIAYLAFMCGSDISAFSADEMVQGIELYPSDLSLFLGEEVFDLGAHLRPEDPDIRYFGPVGPATFSRPCVVDVSPACNPLFWSSVEAGLFDEVAGDLVIVEIATARNAGEIARDLTDARRSAHLKRIKARRIVVANEHCGAFDPAGFGQVVTVPRCAAYYWERARGFGMSLSISQLMAMDTRSFVDFINDGTTAVREDLAADSMADIKGWVSRCVMAFGEAGLAEGLRI